MYESILGQEKPVMGGVSGGECEEQQAERCGGRREFCVSVLNSVESHRAWIQGRGCG